MLNTFFQGTKNFVEGLLPPWLWAWR